MPLHVSSTFTRHQGVKIALYGLWYHHTYSCDDDLKANLMQYTKTSIQIIFQSLSNYH